MESIRVRSLDDWKNQLDETLLKSPLHLRFNARWSTDKKESLKESILIYSICAKHSHDTFEHRGIHARVLTTLEADALLREVDNAIEFIIPHDNTGMGDQRGPWLNWVCAITWNEA